MRRGPRARQRGACGPPYAGKQHSFCAHTQAQLLHHPAPGLTSSSREGDTAPCTSCPAASWPWDRACRMSRMRRPTPAQGRREGAWMARGTASDDVGAGSRVSIEHRHELFRAGEGKKLAQQQNTPEAGSRHEQGRHAASPGTCRPTRYVRPATGQRERGEQGLVSNKQGAAPSRLSASTHPTPLFAACTAHALRKRLPCWNVPSPAPASSSPPRPTPPRPGPPPPPPTHPPTKDAALAVAHGADAVQRAPDAGTVVRVEEVAVGAVAQVQAPLGGGQVGQGVLQWVGTGSEEGWVKEG